MLFSQAFRDKWRPPLYLVIAAVLCIMLLLPLAGISFFRVYENQLIETTESELIAQSAAIAAAMAQRLSEIGGQNLPLGAEVPMPSKGSYRSGLEGLYLSGGWTPVLTKLDLTKTAVLPGRAPSEPSGFAVHSAYERVGKDLDQVLLHTQRMTLAGFRLLDYNGTVIAGRYEVGQSLAHVKEVKAALTGRYASVLRERIVQNPMPIYTISRGTSVRVFVALPVVVDNRVAGVVYASRTPSNILREMFLKRESLFLLAMFVLSTTSVVGLIFARAISSPIQALTKRSVKIGNGDRSALQPLKIHGNREIHALSESMLDMSRKLFERNDYINTFANHVTHELKSPLTAIQGAAELLKDSGADLSDADRERFLSNILTDTNRATLLLNRLRDLARADSVDIRGVSQLKNVVADICSSIQGITIICNDDAQLPMSVENTTIVLGNLIDNSKRHSADKFIIEIKDLDKKTKILIQDNGEGVSQGNAHQIFDLFFTTRREAGGTGMGLGIVQALLKAHGASISLVQNEHKGACFEIVFSKT